jgi:serine/threonine protein kinase
MPRRPLELLISRVPTPVMGLPERIGLYRIVCPIGLGGMGIVYLGCAEGPGGFERQMAIKVIHQQFSRDPRFSTMFFEEARIMARIHHPNVVPVYEVGEDLGRCYIAMDYVDPLPMIRFQLAPQLQNGFSPIEP